MCLAVTYYSPPSPPYASGSASAPSLVMAHQNVFDRLYNTPLRRPRSRRGRRGLASVATQSLSVERILRDQGTSSVMPLTGFSTRPNTPYKQKYRSMSRYAAFMVSATSDRSKIVLDPARPSSPKVVLHLEAEVGSANMKRSAHGNIGD